MKVGWRWARDWLCWARVAAHSPCSNPAQHLQGEEQCHTVCLLQNSCNSCKPATHSVVSLPQGEKPHAGFPEAAYHQMAERLARAGHKVRNRIGACWRT